MKKNSGKMEQWKRHLQIYISLNITKLCKDEKYNIMMMYVKLYSCRL